MRFTQGPTEAATFTIFNPMPNYTREYYIERFSAIPDHLWFVGEFTNPKEPSQHCAYGHLGCEVDNDANEESNTLDRMFRDQGLLVTSVNDGDGSKQAGKFKKTTPKARILAALESFT